MRIIIIFSLFYSFFLTNLTASELPDYYFKITTINKYSEEFILIYKNKKKWVCKTESVPYREIREISNLINLFENIVSKEENLECINQFKIENKMSNSIVMKAGCRRNKEFNSLLSMANKFCRF